MRILYVALVVTLCWACGSKSTPVVVSDSHQHIVSNYFGEGFESDQLMTVSDALKGLQSTEKINGQVIGVVQEVCQAKGCWLTIADDVDSEHSFFVKFHDYSFFVPMDIAGRTVVLNGEAYKSETSVADLRHFAEDAGKSAEEIAAITEPEEEYKFMATGVYLEPK